MTPLAAATRKKLISNTLVLVLLIVILLLTYLLEAVAAGSPSNGWPAAPVLVSDGRKPIIERLFLSIAMELLAEVRLRHRSAARRVFSAF